MDKVNSVSQLAAFATIKSLSDAKKYQSPYQLLAEFIRYIISENALHSFQTTEMKNLLHEKFGFSVPESVVKTTARNMDGVTLSEGIYTISFPDLGSDSLFEEKKQEADEINSDILVLLTEYIKKRAGDNSVKPDILSQELSSFLVGEQPTSGQYTDLISEFILKNENTKVIQDGLNKIREGSILYLGLNHNIGETGSITKPLTLFLGTEVLFSLVGYNGEIYQQLATDFYNQVRAANSGRDKKITLRYFSEVKREVDDFFSTAEDIADGKRTQLIDKPAMVAITKGCSTASDVAVKQSDFYYKINHVFGIAEDSNDNYYDELSFESNLESFDYIDDDDKCKKKETGIKYVSHINKLRNGNISPNDIDSEFLLVTNTKATLLISREQSNRIKEERGIDSISNFAVSLDRITSLLWYKLGNGFGNKEFPASISAVLRARVVLSASIAKNAEKAYSDIKHQFESGIINEEQLAGRIITLKNKPKLPEELQGDDIAEIMDFSPEFLSRYEEEHKTNQKALAEKDKILEDLRKEADYQLFAKDAQIASQAEMIEAKDKSLSEKEATIDSQTRQIEDQDEENKALRSELEKYRAKEAKEKEKREHKTMIKRFVLSVGWKLLATLVIVAILVLICNRIISDTSNTPGIVIGILGLLPTGYTIITKDYKKYLSKTE